jgi:uncharacterized membrane protein YphA (DoxX/SURF4 family)
MIKENQFRLMPAALTVLRILVGWHFLYEGIIKLAAGNWSSYFYLAQSRWILSDFFQWIMANPTALAITDFVNVWGLIFIGMSLFLGIFTRVASIFGIGLLLMYYMAVPPFIAPSSGGYYYIINNQIIEAGILLVFVFIRKDYLWGIDRLLKIFHQKRKNSKFPVQDNHDFAGADTYRREFIKNLAVLPVFGGAFFGMAKKVGWFSFEEEKLKKADGITSASVMQREIYDLTKLQGKVPVGKIKNVEISRMIPGGNLVAGFAHARDLIYVSKWIKQYHSDEKVIETLWIYQDVGINTVIMRVDDQTIRILKEFWRRGGKMQWLAQAYPIDDDLSNIQKAIDAGAIGAFVVGNTADRLVKNNKLEFLARPIEYIQSQGLIAGTAGHSITVPMACAANGIKADFFMKTFHHHNYWSATPIDPSDPYLPPSGSDRNMANDNIWCPSDSDVSEFFRKNTTPWIAYKVLAAGAIKPEDGFKYAFENGADFICVGMFDFQVIENANIVYNILNPALERERKWYA